MQTISYRLSRVGCEHSLSTMFEIVSSLVLLRLVGFRWTISRVFLPDTGSPVISSGTLLLFNLNGFSSSLLSLNQYSHSLETCSPTFVSSEQCRSWKGLCASGRLSLLLVFASLSAISHCLTSHKLAYWFTKKSVQACCNIIKDLSSRNWTICKGSLQSPVIQSNMTSWAYPKPYQQLSIHASGALSLGAVWCSVFPSQIFCLSRPFF